MRSATRKKTGRNPKYLAWIRSLPCCVCEALRQVQVFLTEAAHVGDRGLSQKCPDSEALPVCGRHHRHGRYSLHRFGKKFWKFHGIDRDELIKHYQDLFTIEAGVFDKEN